MHNVYHSFLKTPQDTKNAAETFAKKITSGAVIFLSGPLGAGKTSFVQGFLQAFGITENVHSPTYSLVETYTLSDITLHHFDLYRLKSPEELYYLGIEEYFTPQSICLIEWPEQGGNRLPKADWRVILSYEAEGRNLRIEHTGILSDVPG